MRSVKYVPVLTIVSALIFVSAAVQYTEAANKTQGSTLTGLAGIHVVVEKIDPDMMTETLVTRTVKKDMEARLSGVGINIVDEKKMLGTPGMPYLYINLSTARNGEIYAYHIAIELRQEAVLERDPNITATVTTWAGQGATGAVPRSQINVLRTYMENSVSEFIEAYIKANPDKTPAHK